MTPSFTSTVPGAISALVGYFDALKTANPALSLGAYAGLPIANVANNFLAVGAFPSGDDWVTGYDAQFVGLPEAVGYVSETYAVQGFLRVWAGNSKPITRIDQAFTLLSQLRTKVEDDPQAGDTLTASGSWGGMRISMPLCGPMGGRGWGVVLGFEMDVINVRI